jgi:predicted O-methyltransferase YrrM
LTLLATGESTTAAVIGAILVSTAAIALTRHLWREADRKGKQDTASAVNALKAEVDRIAAANTLELGTEIQETSRRVEVFTKGVLEYIAQLEMDTREIRGAQAAHAARVNKQFEQLDIRSQRYRDHVLTQLSGVVGLYETLKPPRPYPSFGGWAIAGDCALRLVRLILSMRPELVLETGSGLSTILVAQALELAGSDGKVVSLEHQAEWVDATTKMVAEYGVDHRSQVIFAPLVDTVIGKETFKWYDMTQFDLPQEINILFIDGPPNATGQLARYPAIPLLYDRLTTDGVVLMDDAIRPEEKSVVDRWAAEFPDLVIRTHRDAKGTVELTKGER